MCDVVDSKGIDLIRYGQTLIVLDALKGRVFPFINMVFNDLGFSLKKCHKFLLYLIWNLNYKMLCIITLKELEK